MKVGSLFSGAGGFELGFHAQGWECAWACEIDKHARAVYRRAWPEVLLHHDITQLRGRKLEPVDLVCAGFPCQDLSVAGKRAGLAGERSGLFHVLMGLIADMRIRPRWIVLENVPGLLSAGQGRDMATVIRALEDCGYFGAYRVLDLQFFRVPQRRRRVFFVFHLGDWRYPAKVLFKSESLPGNPPPSRKEGTDVARSLTQGLGSGGPDDNRAQAGHIIPTHAVAFGINGGDTGYTLRANPSRSGDKGDGGMNTSVVAYSTKLHNTKSNQAGKFYEEYAPGLHHNSPPPALIFGGARRLMPVECERLMSWPDNHTRYGVDDEGKEFELIDSARYRLCGNGVGAKQSEWLAGRIQAVEA